MDVDGLGIELDIFGIADFEGPAAADGCPDAHAAAASESAVKPTPSLTAEPRRERPQDVEVDMNRTSSGARRLTGTITDGYGDVC
jgi:hypothetical protein